MKLPEFYKKFDKVPRDERFEPIKLEPAPSSLFIIFQRLTVIRAQQRFYREQEQILLNQAERGFNQRENGNSTD